MPEEQSNYTWYLDPCGDERTNEAIVRMLKLVPGLDVEHYECIEQLCEDGVHRSLWRCPSHDFASQIVKYVQRHNYAYAIFRKQGRYGKIRPWPFTPDFHETSHATVK